MILQKLKWFLIIIILQICFFHSNDHKHVINLKYEKKNQMKNDKKREMKIGHNVRQEWLVWSSVSEHWNFNSNQIGLWVGLAIVIQEQLQ
jgi:hypothetical protein